ncbi:hypothetical protein [Roseiconus lacunae]|uniref:hypothetical protein n=1 Tax=Roseiconus lacunae TaxID=2605694 RepID=UPI001E3EA326|nr:hypothetical protein [Roseiconus lacunae]MCD0459964.1 hypothetical protein [Roseiconus lacunae]
MTDTPKQTEQGRFPMIGSSAEFEVPMRTDDRTFSIALTEATESIDRLGRDLRHESEDDSQSKAMIVWRPRPFSLLESAAIEANDFRVFCDAMLYGVAVSLGIPMTNAVGSNTEH